MTINRRFAASLATGSLVLSMASPALANTHMEVSGNGQRSNNSISIQHHQSDQLYQINNAHVMNDVNIRSNTGGNSANGNNRSNAWVRSGDSNNFVYLKNDLNKNYLHYGGSYHDDSYDSNHDYGYEHNNDYDDSDMEHYYGKQLIAYLHGSKEVPGPGDADGRGDTNVTMNKEAGKLCVSMHVSHIEPATAAHIHKGPKGVAGPVVVPLPTPDSNGYAEGCVDVDETLLKEIKHNPSEYYVNVHNAQYPNGAIRGQLYK